MGYHCGMEPGPAQLFETELAAWFCLRTQIKHERLAAAHLRLMEDVEVLFPRMTFQRKWRQTVREFTEPLFPNYLFARFNPHEDLARVRHAYGVQTVVHFGNRLPVIPETVINDIRQHLSAEQTCRLETDLAPDDTVIICGGAFSGLQALIKTCLPRKHRVTLLLEFLGRQVNIEISDHEVAKQHVHPLAKFR
jgi:transcriptional antiterminator RfaH